MKINIENKKRNPFFKREELMVIINHEKQATPSLAVLREHLAKHFEKHEDHIDIRNVFSEKGKAESRAKIFIWDEKRSIKKVIQSTANNTEKKEEIKEEVKKEEE